MFENLILWIKCLFSLIVLVYCIVYPIYLFRQIRYFKTPDRVFHIATKLRPLKVILPDIISEFCDNKTNIYYFVELGAGAAGVSRFVSKEYKWKNVIAVELDRFVLFWGKSFNFITRGRVDFVNLDLFKYNIPKPAVVYCYLFPEMISKLHKEGKLNNTLLISLTFPLEDVLPDAEYTLKNFQRKLLVYDFREKT